MLLEAETLAPPVGHVCRRVVTAELGDYCPDEHPAGYLSRLQLLPSLTEDTEKKITELHARHRYVQLRWC